ncbi:helicase-associated domain-containing protein [Nocardioides sp.]|uniref:helicase-associated domain-containing protein n=1 Tax=Nocardioides sp. TaxID=35761 RepID=UPI00351626A3
MGTSAASGFRSLADQLRSWSDERLTALLLARPDLSTPAPHDFGHLASRATVRASVMRALDQLTLLELTVLDALVVAGQTTRDELATLVHAAPEATHGALDRLVDLALAWESSLGWRAVAGVADALGTGPGTSGLLPRGLPPREDADLRGALQELSPAALAMLRHVVDHRSEADPGTARLAVAPADAATPAEELLARGLLVPRTQGRRVVVVPGEVGLAVRGGRTTSAAVDAVPPLLSTPRDPAVVDSIAAGAAFEAVRRVELLLEAWGADPPGVLRSGGVGVRDLRAAAALLQVPEATAALFLETAHAAGLLGSRADAEGDPVWVPTDAFDTWAAAPPAVRWIRLVRTWLDSPRTPALAGTKDEARKTRTALSVELVAPGLPETRHAALDLLAALPPGEGLASGTGPPSLVAQLAWHRPRRPRQRETHVLWTLAEAAEWGLVARDGVASPGRALLAGAAEDDVAALLAPLLPAPVDHVLLQADLTAVAPGPLEAALARQLQSVAEVESRGGATVYRFTPGSVRHALDLGWTAVELHAFVTSVSRTPVPQPLTYLIDDTVRTFGRIRVGHAEAFLRADDETALAELLHHPRAAGLGLRRLAPTVLVSSIPIEVLLPRLRELGAAPVVEAADGSVVVARPEPLRARTPGEREAPRALRDLTRIGAAVTALRAGDRAGRLRSGAPDPREMVTPASTLAVLREALERSHDVLIGYVDDQGVASDRLVTPRDLEGGSLIAHDHRADAGRAFRVHRITSARPVAPGEVPPAP